MNQNIRASEPDTPDIDAVTVWVIETVAYDSQVVGVASSPDKAADLLMQRFAEPYQVRWERIGPYSLVGRFQEVLHFSTRHDAEFVFTPYVIDAPRHPQS